MCCKLLLANVSINDSQLATNGHLEILSQPALLIILGLMPSGILLERPLSVTLLKYAYIGFNFLISLSFLFIHGHIIFPKIISCSHLTIDSVSISLSKYKT